MKGSDNGYGNEAAAGWEPSEEAKRAAREWQNPSSEERGRRDREYICYDAFGAAWEHPAIQAYIATGAFTLNGFVESDPEIVNALIGLVEPNWLPIGVVTKEYSRWAAARHAERKAIWEQERVPVEHIDPETGEVAIVAGDRVAEERQPGVSLAVECPYPGVIPSGLADRAVQRQRAPVVLPYRKQA